jgi:hypothetical protein
MTEPEQVDEGSEPASEVVKTPREAAPISLREFLEDTPPGQTARVADICSVRIRNGTRIVEIVTPEILLHCEGKDCNGFRFFRFQVGDRIFKGQSDEYSQTYLTYRCSNCQKTEKVYSLNIIRESADSGICYKYGELPPYGPRTPPRLLDLFGKDRYIFFRGRRCESQGLGIGAFVYYRRVVESHKNQILDEVIKVCRKISAPADMLMALEGAKRETQFTKALASVKDAIPQALLVDAHNPLTLLHKALSGGLHNKTDAECLSLAQAIRVVLADLAERLGQALKDEAELKSAVSKLLKVNQGS